MLCCGCISTAAKIGIAGRGSHFGGLPAEQVDHLVAGIIDVLLHGATRFAGIMHFDRPQNVRMPDPAWHGLGAERIETSYVSQRQAQLRRHSLVAGEFRQTAMELSVGTKY